jgi:hypothetical protein
VAQTRICQTGNRIKQKSGENIHIYIFYDLLLDSLLQLNVSYTLKLVCHKKGGKMRVPLEVEKAIEQQKIPRKINECKSDSNLFIFLSEYSLFY